MQHFPVVCSTLSAAHLGAFLHERFNLGANTSCKLIRAAINHAYIVTDGDDHYVFRVYSLDWRNDEEILAELELLQLLQDNNVPVAYGLKDVDGKYLQTLYAPEGVRRGVLFSFARGEKMLSIFPEMHFKIGEIMANMHRVTENLSLNRDTYSVQNLLVDSFERVKLFLSIETEEMQYMLKLQQYLIKELQQIDGSNLRKGIVHLDIWFDNLHIYNNEEATIFDFDFCGNGWLALDLAYYQMQLVNTEREPDQYHARWEAFVKGYTSTRPISEEEYRIIPLLSLSLYFFYLGVQCERFENWTNSFLNETYLKRYITVVVKRLYEFHNLPA